MSKHVDSSMADLFYDQCLGDSAGHMAAIPNSPIIQSIAKAHDINTKQDFAVFLREVADWLDGGGLA